LLESERTPLFGFIEPGSRPAIVLAIAAETVTMLALGAFAVMTARGAAAEPRRH
jgi:hypothetical protein